MFNAPGATPRKTRQSGGSAIKDCVFEVYHGASFVIGGVEFNDAVLGLVMSGESLSTRKDDKAIIWLGGLCSQTKRPVFQAAFEEAFPAGAAWKYLGPNFDNNLTAYEVENDVGDVLPFRLYGSWNWVPPTRKNSKSPWLLLSSTPF